MSFPAKYLNEGEEVVVDLRPHWWFLAAPSFALVAALALAIAAKVNDLAQALVLATLVLAVAALLWFLGRYARWATTSFVVTTDRLIHRTGVLSKHGKEIPLERLNDVGFHQSLFQRILGAGDLLIESGGERGQEAFESFPHPQDTQNIIHRQIELAQARDAARMAGGRRGELSPLEQLEKLEELRQRGVITQAEFELKKAKLLDRL